MKIDSGQRMHGFRKGKLLWRITSCMWCHVVLYLFQNTEIVGNDQLF